MMKKRGFNKIFGMSCFFLIMFVTCKVVFINDDSGQKNITVSMLKVINGDISNWKMAQAPDSFTLWTAANFYDDINGGLEVYTDRGPIEIADMHLVGPIGSDGVQNVLEKRSFIMDYGTEANAIEEFNFMKSQNSADAFSFDEYGKNTAFAVPILGGIIAYAHFKKFYIELKFTGFSDQPNAVRTAIQFLSFFESKIGKK